MIISEEEKTKIKDFLFPAFSFIIEENHWEVEEDSWDVFCMHLPLLFDGKKYADDCGATKGVLIPSEDKDYVIKIPFIRNRDVRENYDSDDEYPRDFLGHMADENGYYWYEGWDYCDRETYLFKKAEDLQLDSFFCEIECIGFCCDWPVYVQKRAIPFKKINKADFSPEKKKEVSTLLSQKTGSSCYPLRVEWAYDAYNQYGEAQFTRLISFLSRNEVLDDLHIGNIGYYSDDTPCIFDFSGYYD